MSKTISFSRSVLKGVIFLIYFTMFSFRKCERTHKNLGHGWLSLWNYLNKLWKILRSLKLRWVGRINIVHGHCLGSSELPRKELCNKWWKLSFNKNYHPIYYYNFSKTRWGNRLTCAILVLKVAPLSSCVFSPWKLPWNNQHLCVGRSVLW